MFLGASPQRHKHLMYRVDETKINRCKRDYTIMHYKCNYLSDVKSNVIMLKSTVTTE